jgi:hypothetical protein
LELFLERLDEFITRFADVLPQLAQRPGPILSCQSLVNRPRTAACQAESCAMELLQPLLCTVLRAQEHADKSSRLAADVGQHRDVPPKI